LPLLADEPETEAEVDAEASASCAFNGVVEDILCAGKAEER
jgi:hypothetical protein